jgi:flotillin
MAGEVELIALVVIVLAVVSLMIILSRRYKKVEPDQAMVVYGRNRFQVVTGGARFIYPIINSVRFMSIGAQKLPIRVPDVITRSGVPLTVDCVSVIKISSEQSKLATAAQQWLSKSAVDIHEAAQEIITGHIRGVCATLEVEQINSDRDALSGQIRSVAVPDLANMGLEIVSLTVKDIADQVGYLEALGKKRTAEVKKDAIIGESAARRDAIMKSAEFDKQGQQARFEADALIESARRDRDVKINQYQSQVEIERANKEIAFDLQDRIRRQELIQAEIQIQIREKEKQIELQQKEIERKEKEVEGAVRVPARAEADRAALIADGDRRTFELRATGEAAATFAKGKAAADVVRVTGVAEGDKVRAVGLAEADIIRAKGLSEAAAIEATGKATAEAMLKKADAWAKYQDAAKLQVVVEGLPAIMREMAQPLAGTDKLIMMGGAGGPSGLVENVAQGALKASAMLESMTGVSLGGLVRGIAGGNGEGIERVRKLAAESGLDVGKLLESLGKLSDDEVRNVLKNLSAASGLVEEMGKGHGKK